MKTLNKLEINPEKIMNNEERLTLKGGYAHCYVFKSIDLVNDFICYGSVEDCNTVCNMAQGGGGGYVCSCYEGY